MVATKAVSEGTLKVAKSRGDNSWSFIDDPSDRRCVLIQYDSLKDKYKQAINKHFGGCPHAYIRQSAIKNLLQRDQKALDWYRDKELPNGKGLPKPAIEAYTKAAEWLNLLVKFTAEDPKKTLKALGMTSRREFYDGCIAIIRAEGIELPANYSRLIEKVRAYEQDGYAVLISKKYGNGNSQKINEAAGEWLCAYYSAMTHPTVEQTWMDYNAIAPNMGWQTLDHHSTVYQYLHRPDVYQRWYGLRQGWDKAKGKFGIQFSNERASMRDSLWFADGTGFNFIANDSKMQRIYWVMDDHSEVILGWDVDVSEREQSVYRAFKDAINMSGHKPYNIRYDQSKTHMKIGPFLDNISAKMHFKVQAYNGSSKSIESATGRFQRQVMREYYFFSGQNRGSRNENSVANREAIEEIAKAGLIPDLQTLIAVIRLCIKQWNEAKHPKTGRPRIEMYNESTNPEAVPFTMYDAVECFWNTAAKPITYRAEGLPITVNKVKHLFEVYKNGLPDIEWRKQYIGAEFIVRYDPDDMSQVWLYQDKGAGLQLVGAADAKKRAHISIQDYTEGEGAAIRALQDLRKSDMKQRKEEAREMAGRHGYLPLQIAERKIAELAEEGIVITPAKRKVTVSLADAYRDDDNYQVNLYGRRDVDEMKDVD